MNQEWIKGKLHFIWYGCWCCCLIFLALPAFIFLLGILGIAILTPITQIGLFLRFGEWYEADGFLVWGVWQLLQDNIQINLENAFKMRDHFATLSFGWEWKGLETVTQWFLDLHLTISMIILGSMGLYIWASIYGTLEEIGVMGEIKKLFKK